jgi:hypothetical protein
MSQLQGIEQKDIIKSVTGLVTKLWEPKTFNGPKGEFTIQGGEIIIDGQAYGLKFMNQQHDPARFKGKTITLTSTRGKHGLNGVSLDHESFSTKNGDKVDRDVIKVTATAKIEVLDEPVGLSEPPRREASVARPAPASEDTLMDIIKLHKACNALVRQQYSRITDEETLRAYVSSVFIEANRKGVRLAVEEKVEEAPAPEVPEEPKNDRPDWGSAIVPSGSYKGKKLAEVGKTAITQLYEFYLEKGFTTAFAKCVDQAARDLRIDQGGPDEGVDLE